MNVGSFFKKKVTEGEMSPNRNFVFNSNKNFNSPMKKIYKFGSNNMSKSTIIDSTLTPKVSPIGIKFAPNSTVKENIDEGKRLSHSKEGDNSKT
jgi:hypothetical protein